MLSNNLYNYNVTGFKKIFQIHFRYNVFLKTFWVIL